MIRTIDKLARSGGIVQVVSGVSDETPGEETVVEIDVRDHVGRKVAPSAVIPVATSEAASIAVTGFDADEVTVVASAAEVEFDLIII